jgi:hypothetical protein
MSEDKPKAAAAKPAAKKAPTDQRDDHAELKPSDAQAPGPITESHKSGDWDEE